jgi:hypothetical protein
MTIKRWFLAIPGALLVGALGSGLWEIGIKPAGTWIGRATLDVVTLGSSQLKDAVYLEAAKGNHEKASLEIWSVVIIA